MRMQMGLNLEGNKGARLCDEIVKLDRTVIFASIGSFSGFEIAYAESASMPVLVGRSPRLKEKYCSLVASVVNSVKQAQELFGCATMIITEFEKNLRIIVIPLFQQEIFLFLITTRESESRSLAFQVSRLIQRFEKS